MWCVERERENEDRERCKQRYSTAEGKASINNEELLAKLKHLLQEALHYRNSQVIPLGPSPGRWHQEAGSVKSAGPHG